MRERAARYVLLLLVLLSAVFVCVRLSNRGREVNRISREPRRKTYAFPGSPGKEFRVLPQETRQNRNPRPPVNIPLSVPDITGMIRAEKPVQVDSSKADRSPTVDSFLDGIRWRKQHGDYKEAVRLCQEFADRNRGTPAAALALDEIMNTYNSNLDGRKLDATYIALYGRTALRMAEEHPGYSRTAEALGAYISRSLDGLEYHMIEPSQEEWRCIFKAGAIFAGRYPSTSNAPTCIFRIAKALYPVSESRTIALDLLKLVSKWGLAFDARVQAYKALHDHACQAGDLSEAGRLAEEAAKECAGRTSCRYWDAPNEWGGEERRHDSPWGKVAEQGIEQNGRVLIERPEWSRDLVYIFSTREEFRQETGDRWMQAEFAGERWENKLIIATTPGSNGFPCIGYANRIVAGWGRQSTGSHFSGILSPLGNPGIACPYRKSALFLPKFPVREGVEVFPCDRIGLVRQEAREEGGRIVVRIEIDRSSAWTQVWMPGEALWTEGRLDYEVQREGCSGEDYDEEFSAFRGSMNRRFIAARPGGTGRENSHVTTELQKSVLAMLDSWYVDSRIHDYVEEKARSLFSAIELAGFFETWKHESSSDIRNEEQVDKALVKEADARMARGDFRSVLAKLSVDRHWVSRLYEMRNLKAKAYFSLGERLKALELLALLPAKGGLADPKARLIEVKALLAEGETGDALVAAIEVGLDFKGTSEAEEADGIAKDLSWRKETMRCELASNPYKDFRLRNLWQPKRCRHFSDARIEEMEGRKALSVRSCDKRIILTNYGCEIEVPSTDSNDMNRFSEYCSTAREEFWTGEGIVYFREADRIVAETTGGEEIWRHEVRPESLPEFIGHSQPGLTRLANPVLRNVGGKDLIFCGIGHRATSVGMGIHFMPFGGGILVLDKSGRKVWQTDQGYCKAMNFTNDGNGTNLLIGLFNGCVKDKASNWSSPWFLEAINPLNGERIWRSFLKREKEPGWDHEWNEGKPILVLGRMLDGKKHSVIVVSLGKAVWFFLGNGRQIALMDDFSAAFKTDFDSDGSDELVLHAKKETYERGGQLTITGATSNVLWVSSPERWNPVCAEDMDGDGWKELVATRDDSPDAVGVFGRFAGGHFGK